MISSTGINYHLHHLDFVNSWSARKTYQNTFQYSKRGGSRRTKGLIGTGSRPHGPIIIINNQNQLLFPSWSKSKWKPLKNQTWIKSITWYVNRMNVELEDFRYTREAKPWLQESCSNESSNSGKIKSYILGSKAVILSQWENTEDEKNDIWESSFGRKEIYLNSSNSGFVPTPDEYVENNAHNYQELFTNNI